MDKRLDGLRWKPRWVSHLGCVKGCLEYLGLDISWPWLYGGTGHAFVINMHEVVCPSGPTAWNYEMLFRLGLNLGYKVSCVFGSKHDPKDFASKQTKGWIHVCNSLEADIPCYGWELKMPEFYVIYGVDDDGYYYSGPGCEDGEGPKPWSDLGDSMIGILEVFSVERIAPVADEKTVKDALDFAVEHSRNPKKWILADYSSGHKAFYVWANALDQGTASRFGQGYNAAVWAECRSCAVDFLMEAKQRLPGRADSLFDEAAAHYAVVRDRLKAVSELYPFAVPDPASEDERLQSPEAARLVREAGSAEQKGLEALAELVKAI